MFLEENLGTIVVAAIVLGSGILAVRSIRRKSVYGCGGSCTGDCCGCLGPVSYTHLDVYKRQHDYSADRRESHKERKSDHSRCLSGLRSGSQSDQRK